MVEVWNWGASPCLRSEASCVRVGRFTTDSPPTFCADLREDSEGSYLGIFRKARIRKELVEKRLGSTMIGKADRLYWFEWTPAITRAESNVVVVRCQRETLRWGAVRARSRPCLARRRDFQRFLGCSCNLFLVPRYSSTQRQSEPMQK
jgi:hypothetical protein